MPHIPVGYLSLVALLLLSACAPRPELHRAEFTAMGTLITIDIVSENPEQARAAIAAARDEMQRLGTEWYPWEPTGELARLNRALASGEWMSVSPKLAKLLARSQELHRLSGGTFDPAVGHLVEMWGFHRAERDPAQTWPDAKQLAAWEASHPTFADITVDEAGVGSRRTDLQLDLGAIGKGYAVDSVVEMLRQRGIVNALINAGGNLRGIGRAAYESQDRPWRIAIRSPRAAEALAGLELDGDESLSTSGDYERFGMRDGVRVNHLLDPRTGRSATHTIAVTVLASDATLADAASTAIFVAGPNDWRDVARNLGIRHVLRLDSDGAVTVTREFANRLHSPGSDAHQRDWRVVDL